MNSEPMRATRIPLQWRVTALGSANDRIVLFFDSAAQQQRDRRRHERQRQHQRAKQSDHHRERHRLKHFSFDARQREDGQIHQHDDQYADQARREDLARRGVHRVKPLVGPQQTAEMLLPVGEPQDAVFDDDHGAVDDQAEVERAKRHQVGAHLVLHHARDQEQHGQRNHHRRQHCRAHVAEHHQQHGYHEGRAFEQVQLHRCNGPVHEHRAIVDGLRGHAVR
jgi:hypothetical protein